MRKPGHRFLHFTYRDNIRDISMAYTYVSTQNICPQPAFHDHRNATNADVRQVMLSPLSLSAVIRTANSSTRKYLLLSGCNDVLRVRGIPLTNRALHKCFTVISAIDCTCNRSPADWRRPQAHA
ncbi:unnamed protein product [Periconia digitata]|uniref:Uncharacterized protein n=1 Tax=Periconia digitata TaxID=1303443 RepID=A0A9W4XIR7_9PLEO|nr:unnamed protein product [Periconia digitata]